VQIYMQIYVFLFGIEFSEKKNAD
jgi:hypothetical protein